MTADEQKIALARLLAGTFEWAAADDARARGLGDAAIDHGVDALVWEKLAGHAAAAAATLRTVLEPRARAAATRDLFVRRDLETVLEALGAGGVPTLVTKGTALAYTVYREPWLRPRTDSDLLVRHGDVPSACRILERQGYTRSTALSTGEFVSHQIAFERTDAHGVDHVIDLHWKIVNPQVVADALTFDELWRDAEMAPQLGSHARVPSTIGSVALGCVHRLAHHQGQDRLIWLHDLDLLASSMNDRDWHGLGELACRQQIAGFCLAGLRSARACFGTRIPEAVEGRLEAAAPAEPSRAYIEGPVTRRDVLLSDLAVLGTWRARARLVREHAFPPRSFMQQRYGTRARWALPALYLHRLVTGASKWVRS